MYDLDKSWFEMGILLLYSLHARVCVGTQKQKETSE